ncbi:MAG: nickel pincer cofactor biosynthesis protein LarC, partial [Prochlorotrichaceae cyanobacterium]
MCLGALVHAGVPLDYLQKQLAQLGIDPEYQLWAEQVQRNGQSATKIHVDLSDRTAPPVRHLKTIEGLITQAQLPDRVEAWSLAIFRKLAEAEAAVHGSTPERVHFHEVGATDALIDIVGTCLGLDWLGIEAVYCSPLPTGGGTVRAAHGRLPAPVPAVLQLWQMGKVPVYGNGIHRELVTPTGAAIVVTLAKGFGECPPLILERVGLGAGDATFTLPNILRLWIGQSSEDDRSGKKEEISDLAHSHSHDRSHPHDRSHSHTHPREHDHPEPAGDETEET